MIGGSRELQQEEALNRSNREPPGSAKQGITAMRMKINAGSESEGERELAS